MASTDPDNIASDPLIAQLTDALRAGPDSPEWHAVISRLKQDGVEGSDEQKMLVAVRELLEQGKDYRTVRAGPGFTRKLMDKLDESPKGSQASLPMATFMAVVGGLAVTAIVAGVVITLIKSSGGGIEGQKARLRDVSFERTVVAASFDRDVPAGWETIGTLALDAGNGLRVAATQPTTEYRAAGIVSIATIQANDAGAIEALVRTPSDPNTIVQLFVRAESTSPASSAVPDSSGAVAGELAWVLHEGKSRVVLPPNGQFAGPPVPFDTMSTGTLVRVAVGERVAIVTAGGREIYAGPCNLSHNQPRTFGIRFLTKGNRNAGEAIVLSAKVVRP